MVKSLLIKEDFLRGDAGKGIDNIIIRDLN